MIQVTFKCNTWGDLEALLRIASMAKIGATVADIGRTDSSTAPFSRPHENDNSEEATN